jgi:hypothetical protein
LLVLHVLIAVSLFVKGYMLAKSFLVKSKICTNLNRTYYICNLDMEFVLICHS